MSSYKALFTDLDGTLLNTAEFIYQAMEYALRRNHLAIPPRAEIQKVMGPPLEELYQIFYPDADAIKLSQDHREFQLQHLNLANLFPNTRSTLDKIREAGLKIAAISTRSRLTVEETLERNNLLPYFDLIITGDDVAKCKPDPEGLLLALKQLKLQPDQVIMVGDTDADVLAAHGAGVKAIGCTYGLQGDLVAQHQPEYLIGDIAEVLPIVLG